MIPHDVTSGFFKENGSKPNWLNYTTFEGVVYDDEYAEYLTPAGRNALWRYVDCGGSLAYFGSGKMQAWWAELDPRLADKTLKHGAFEKYEIGFGALYLVGIDDEALEASGAAAYDLPDSVIDMARSWYDAEPAKSRLHTAYGANQVLPMAEPIDSGATYQRFFVLMLILAVLIGPAHLYLLKRMKRRGWTYWTTPALAALACGALVLYASVTIGWRQQTRVVSLTHLDQGAGRAATIGWAAYYSPLTSFAELRFDENTELTPLAFGSELVGSVDWTDGQRLTGGWVQAGIPRHFKLRKNEDRPERINLKRDGDGIKIVNRLGAPRQDVLVRRPWRQGFIKRPPTFQTAPKPFLTEKKGHQNRLEKAAGCVRVSRLGRRD